MAHSPWSLSFPELLCQVQVHVQVMSSERQFRPSLASSPDSLWPRRYPIYLRSAFLLPALAAFPTLHTLVSPQSQSHNFLLDSYVCIMLANKNFSAGWVSITSLQNTHFRFLELLTIAAPRPWRVINFHKELISIHLFPSPCPCQQIIATVMFLKLTLFSISSYPSPNRGHSTTVRGCVVP